MNFSEPCIPIAQLKRESECDRHLMGLSQRIISGGWGAFSRWEGHFKRIARQLTVDENGLIRFGSRVVPPQSLHRRILEAAHQSHNGMDSTLRLIQREFF